MRVAFFDLHSCCPPSHFGYSSETPPLMQYIFKMYYISGVKRPQSD